MGTNRLPGIDARAFSARVLAPSRAPQRLGLISRPSGLVSGERVAYASLRVHFQVRHESLYRYDVPVQLGSHVVRLTPRAEGTVLGHRRLTVAPVPVFQTEEVDAYGNSVTRVEFNGSTQTLHVLSELELDVVLPPPLTVSSPSLPFTSGEYWLNAYRQGPFHPSVLQFAQALASEAQGEPVRFLDHLTRTLYTRTDRHIRPTGHAREAHETLALGSGACRDLTVLFLEACRSQGLAARFVSGYQAQAQTPDGQRHLHAWAEVFLPGLGWSGWDATHGVRVTDGHVALCAAPHQAATMPIEGGFFFQGATVNSTLDHSVRIATS
jgi:transglutaminase-like putative cysteine protease